MASYIHLNSWEIVFFRTMLGSIVLLAAFLLRGQRFTLKEKKKDALLQIISGVSNAACWICLYEGYQLIGVNIPTLLSYGGSVLVMVLSPLLFREKLTWARCAGFLSVIVGDVLLTGGLNSSEQGTKGILYGILAGVFFAVLIICNKKARIEGFEKATLQKAKVPMLAAVSEILPWMSLPYCIITLVGVFTTIAGYLWTCGRRVGPDGTWRMRIAVIVVDIVGITVGAMIPLDKLVNFLFSLSGYAGIVMFATCVIGDIIRWRKGKLKAFPAETSEPAVKAVKEA